VTISKNGEEKGDRSTSRTHELADILANALIAAAKKPSPGSPPQPLSSDWSTQAREKTKPGASKKPKKGNGGKTHEKDSNA